ncbi:MAG: hypothetical protein VX498_12045, partial [Myxococcota bacterium]|nr:hypothetical protein [Myxococcota bacterium]
MRAILGFVVLLVGVVLALPAQAQFVPDFEEDLASGAVFQSLSVHVESLHGGPGSNDPVRIYGWTPGDGPNPEPEVIRVTCALQAEGEVPELACGAAEPVNFGSVPTPGAVSRVSPWGDGDLMADSLGGSLIKLPLDGGDALIPSSCSHLPNTEVPVRQPVALASFQGRLFFAEGLDAEGEDNCGGCLGEDDRPGGIHSTILEGQNMSYPSGDYSVGSWGMSIEAFPASATRAMAVLSEAPGSAVVAVASGSSMARVQLWDYDSEDDGQLLYRAGWGLPVDELSCGQGQGVLGSPLGLGLLRSPNGGVGGVVVASVDGIA